MKKTFLALFLILAMLFCIGCDGEEPTVKSCTVGGSLENGTIKMTFNSVEAYVDNDEYPMDTPAEGKMFVILKFTAENIGDEDDYINMFDETSYCDDAAIDPVSILFNYDGETIWGDVAVGKTRSGYIAYEVDQDWQKLEFIWQWDTWDDDATMTFTAYRSDLQA